MSQSKNSSATALLILGLVIFTSFTLSPSKKRKLAVLWDTDVIPVCWLNPNKGNEIERVWVRNAIKRTWEAASNLKFTGWCKCGEYNTKGGNGIRISVGDVPSESRIGKVADRDTVAMRLNFTFKNTPVSLPVASNYYSDVLSESVWPNSEKLRKLFIEAQAVHEFGHVLGFSHEQGRDDCAQNNCTNFETMNPYDSTLMVAPCNDRSVMNYCNDIYLNEGYLSSLDVFKLLQFYPDSRNRAEDSLSISYTADNKHTLFKKRVRNTNKKPKEQKQQQQQGPSKGIVITAKEVSINIKGSQKIINNIDSVVYYFHRETFKPMFSTDREDNYQIVLTKVWGNFMCEAKIYFKNDNSVIISKYIFANNDTRGIQSFAIKLPFVDRGGKGAILKRNRGNN